MTGNIESTLLDIINRQEAICPQLIYLNEIASTNEFLLGNRHFDSGCICVTDKQSQGRGQNNTKWIAPVGENITGSVLWHFKHHVRHLGSLSLWLGVNAVNTLKTFGYQGIQLKWPNDLIFQEKKLAGILVETVVKGDSISVVIGVGLNVNVQSDSMTEVDQPWSDLIRVNPRLKPLRVNLIAHLFGNILNLLAGFEQQIDLRRHWNPLDVCLDKPLVIKQNDQLFVGIGQGINDAGCYLLAVDGDVLSFCSGNSRLIPHWKKI